MPSFNLQSIFDDTPYLRTLPSAFGAQFPASNSTINHHPRYALHRDNALSSPMSHLLAALKPALARSTILQSGKRNFTATRVTMGKQEWMIILPDRVGALEARMKVRPQHLDAIKPQVDSGLVVMGGASLDEPLKEGQGPKINGSVMMCEADTEEEVWKVVKSDVYYKEGVWDAEKIQVFPFKSAVRKGL